MTLDIIVESGESTVNEFGKRFYKILDKYNGKSLLKREIYLEDFVCYCDDFPNELLVENIKLAKEKAKYVSVRNQRGINRSPQEVFVNVFKGIMAETVGQIYLTEICGFDHNSVRRYDLERDSFRYNPEKEYDVGLFRDNLFWSEVGVKASKIQRNRLDNFLKEQHCIIGKYRYDGRAEDHNSAYYLGIIIVYDDSYDVNTFVEEYMKDKIKTYIVSGASFSEMTGVYSSSNIKMNQKGTSYNLGLRSYIAGDADNSKVKLDKIYNDRFVIDYEFSREPGKMVPAYVTVANYLNYFHLTKECPYIIKRDDVIEWKSIHEAKIHGGSTICPECRKIFMED